MSQKNTFVFIAQISQVFFTLETKNLTSNKCLLATLPEIGEISPLFLNHSISYISKAQTDPGKGEGGLPL
jgi:hypothetical protein